MKKIVISLMAIMVMLAFTACGSSNSGGGSQEESIEYDLRSIGSVDCEVDEYGGGIDIYVTIKQSGVKEENIKVAHLRNGISVGRPLKPSVYPDGENYEIFAFVNVKMNDTDKVIDHKAQLIYFEGGVENIYSARCLQQPIKSE